MRGPAPGPYSGTTSGGKPIQFVVSADRSCSLLQVTWTATGTGPAPALGAEAGLAEQPESGFLRTVRDGMCIDRLMTVRK